MPTCDFTDYADGNACTNAPVARLDGVPGLPYVCMVHYEFLEKENSNLLKNVKILDPGKPGKIRPDGRPGTVRLIQP